MRLRWLDRAVLIAVLWLALGLRLYQLDGVPHDYDRSYPHGLGIALLDSLGDGTFPTIALHGQPQSLGLPNPVATYYALAALSLLDRSPYFAMAVIATANLVVAAIAGNLARHSHGRVAGLVAVALAATSPWAVYYARGTWQLSLFELSIAVPAWLIWRGMRQNRRDGIVGGSVVAAVAMHIYTVGFGLLLQLGAQIFVAGPDRARLRAVAVAGCAACGLSLALYAPVLIAARSDFFARPTVRLSYAGEAYGGALVTLPVNLLGGARALGIVGGSDFEDTLITAPEFMDPDRSAVLQARAIVVAAALVLGVIVLARRWRHDLSARFVLTWFAAPVLAIIGLTTVSRSTPVNYYYVLLSSPAGYVCAAAGCAAAARQIWTRAHGPARVLFATGLAAAASAMLLIPAPSLAALTAQHLAVQHADGALDLSLRAQSAIARVWKAQCAELSVPFNPFENRLDLRYWSISLMGSKHKVRPMTEAIFDASQLWVTRADGGTCSTRPVTWPAPPSEKGRLAPNNVQFAVYRSTALGQAAPRDAPRARIGLALVRATLPSTVHAGQVAPVDVAWRIEEIPQGLEPTARYDLFVKLLDPAGRTLAQGDALSPPHVSWRVGDMISQQVVLAVPADVRDGDVIVELSLYDRTLQRNATFSEGPTTRKDGIAVQLHTRAIH